MYKGVTTMANELKPCPFCGGTDISCADAGYKTDIWFVQCEDCGATFPHFDSKEEAIDHWNRRATESINWIADELDKIKGDSMYQWQKKDNLAKVREAIRKLI